MKWRRNGNPLQCSCLENPRDGGAWWIAIYGVAQSRTRLKRLCSSSSSSNNSSSRDWEGNLADSRGLTQPETVLSNKYCKLQLWFRQKVDNCGCFRGWVERTQKYESWTGGKKSRQTVNIKNFFLFLATLGLPCYIQAFSGCSQWGLLFVEVAGFSLLWLLLMWSTGSRHDSFSSCSTRAL